MAQRVIIAEVGAPHGVRGAVRVKTFTADPGDLGAYGPLTTEDGRSLTVVEARPDKTVLVVRFAEIDSREAAQALKGQRLHAERTALPDDDDTDAFYHADLIGLAAVDMQGERLGEIVALHDFGAGDLLDVKVAKGPSVLVPFTREIVPEVDIAGGRVVIDPLPGLFDAPETPKRKRRRSPAAKAKAARKRGKTDA